MPRRKGAAPRAAPEPIDSASRRGIDDQINAMEQERLRSAVSERLFGSMNDLRQ